MYPMHLEGSFKEKIWGGDDLKYFNKSVNNNKTRRDLGTGVSSKWIKHHNQWGI